MTTLIKEAGLNLIESTKAFAERLCSDGSFCDDVLTVALAVTIFGIMWLSLAQLS